MKLIEKYDCNLSSCENAIREIRLLSLFHNRLQIENRYLDQVIVLGKKKNSSLIKERKRERERWLQFFLLREKERH